MEVGGGAKWFLAADIGRNMTYGWSWSQELSLPLSNFLVMDFCSSSWWTRGGDGPLSKAKWLLADDMGGRGDWIVSHCVEIFGVDLCSW